MEPSPLLPKNLDEIIDRLDILREELLGIQQALEALATRKKADQKRD